MMRQLIVCALLASPALAQDTGPATQAAPKVKF